MFLFRLPVTFRELIIFIFLCLLDGVWADDEPANYYHFRNNLSGKEIRVVVGNVSSRTCNIESSTKFNLIFKQFPPTIVVIRNSTGHVIGYSGTLYTQLLWLSKRLNFTYHTFNMPIKNCSIPLTHFLLIVD